jgi:hypothetical protein
VTGSVSSTFFLCPKYTLQEAGPAAILPHPSPPPHHHLAPASAPVSSFSSAIVRSMQRFVDDDEETGAGAGLGLGLGLGLGAG